MLKKLKQKIQAYFNRNIGKRVFFPFILLILTLGWFLPTTIASADSSCSQGNNGQNVQTCDVSQIILKTDTKIKDSSGNLVSGNLAKAGQQDGSFTVEVIVTLVSPASLTFGKDMLALPGQSFVINGAEVTLVPSSTSKFCGNPTIGILGVGTNYTNCSNSAFDVTADNLANQTIQAGSVIIDHTYTVDHTNFGSLGFNSVYNGTDPSSGINNIYAYPSLAFTQGTGLFGVGFKTYYNTFFNGGAPISVQVFPTQAQAATSTTQPQTCITGQTTNCVQQYTGATSASGTAATQTGGGDPITGLINKVIAAILGLINEIIFFIFYWLIAPLIQAMLSIHTYQDQFVNVIYPGWEVVRNVCNIIFIVAILAIGLGTLFRIESYQWRHLVVQLVIAALLVNFSLIIGQAILALADTIQNQFLPNNVDVIRSLARDLMVSNTRNALFNVDLSSLGGFSNTVGLFFYVALAVGSFLIFTALAVFLIIRIVALWVLLMLSPVAYVAGVLPTTAGVRQQWWTNFLKYAFFTPVIAFFLNMTAYISNLSQQHGSVLQQVTASTNFADSNAPTISAFVFKVASNILLLVFLLLAIKAADFFGIYGASAITDIAQKGLMGSLQPWTWPGTGKLSDWKTRKSLEWTAPDAHGKVSLGKKILFSALNPTSAVKGFQAQSKEKRQMTQELAEGQAFDISRQVFGGHPTEERDEKEDQQVKHYASSSPYRGTDPVKHEIADIVHKFKGPKMLQGTAFEGKLMQAAENKDMNDVLLNEGYSADTDGYLAFMDKMVRTGVLSEGRAARLMEKMSSTAFANSEYWYGWGANNGVRVKTDEKGAVYGKGVWDEVEAGRNVETLSGSEKEEYENYKVYQHMLKEQKDKFDKKEPQDIARNLHHSAVRAVAPNGSIGLSTIGANMIVGADDRLYAQADRANAEQVKAFMAVVGTDQAQEEVAQALVQEQKKKGLTLRIEEARQQAKDKIATFSKKYLRYDPASGVKIGKEKVEPMEIMTNVDKLDPDIRTIPNNNREGVKKYFNTAIQNPDKYTFDIPADVNELFGTTPDAQAAKVRIQRSGLQQLSTTLSKNFSPKDLIDKNILPANVKIYVSDLEAAQRQVALSIRKTIETNPSVELNNSDMQVKLQAAIVEELGKTTVFASLSEEDRKKIAQQILATTK